MTRRSMAPPLCLNRVAVGIEYDGSGYSGWQTQLSAPSIQKPLEAALSSVAAHPVQVTCAGRTDAGVHARWQVAHFDTPAARSMRSWVMGANTELPKSIGVSWARPVPRHFHARYSAEARTYRYVILNRAARSALAVQRATWLYKPLDHERMAEAAAYLCGHFDFSAFRSAECQSNSPVRRVESLKVWRQADWVLIEVTANAFLHHMMRNIAGLLIEVGRGEAPALWAREVLEGRDRTRGAPTAPADGLYLWSVRYPPAFWLPDPTPEPERLATGSQSLIIPGLP